MTGSSTIHSTTGGSTSPPHTTESLVDYFNLSDCSSAETPARPANQTTDKGAGAPRTPLAQYVLDKGEI